MKSSPRVLVFWAIAVFIVIGGVLLLVGILEGDETDLQEQPSNGAGLIAPATGE